MCVSALVCVYWYVASGNVDVVIIWRWFMYLYSVIVFFGCGKYWCDNIWAFDMRVFSSFCRKYF